MRAWWDALDQRARIGLLAGAAAIVVATAAGGWWLLRPQQAVLFSDLKAEDAAVMAAELDKQKVPYTVADGGTTLLVDQAQVHATRLKLMGRDLPLRGAVGLELFNHAEFGMTEFAQKINYQRALQGELTRTILSFPEVRDVRVHLAMPEQGLFRQATSRPKAAITLTMRAGHALRPDQVNGIQRLVAAAVPGLATQEVTVVDQHGVALSRVAGEEADAGGGRLDLKRETENYLARKAGVVLERAFGPGQALASVDVTLNMDQVRVTTEDVIGASDGRGGAASGVIVRERESARDSGPGESRGAETGSSRGNSLQREVEYQTGRRVEQVVSQPGSIRRLHVVAVVRQPLDEQQQEQARRLVAVAVGASPERGDAVIVQSMQAAPGAQLAPMAAPAAAAPPATPAWPETMPWLFAALAGAILVAAALIVLRGRRQRPSVAVLTEAQRQVALRRVEAWLHEGERATPADATLVGAAPGDTR